VRIDDTRMVLATAMSRKHPTSNTHPHLIFLRPTQQF
jgi:hypothetical protein